METEETRLSSELKGKVVQIFSDFMSRVAKFEELAAIGNRLLVSFRQGLEIIRKPSIDKTSELFQQVIKANETNRIRSYINAGCVHTSNRVENLNKLHTSHIGLLNNLSEEKIIVNELECLVEDVKLAIEAASESLQDLHHEDHSTDLDPLATNCSQEEMVASEKPESIEYATMVAIVYSMVKQDYVMQEKIVTCLNLKTSSEELESYCLMWSLRPFVNDDIMHQAWRLIP